ncbi:Ubiquitin-conjugating enzyme E2 11 [Dichanthelium oligosanthes]|uniref:Ubiquitin-conjugating enzyme E2 11 n=1 Tax=Dichanthelium oligosanthes TaxID=888268 RepID=A0A1E5USU2_9POAL|nr:Ubiquitin-conjugating enzyme E2 11 [Dichanthelium oligosanthes]
MWRAPWVDPPEPNRGRFRRELRTIWVDPPPFCRPRASPVTDLLHWEVVIDDPDGTLTPEARSPSISRSSAIYHPNINSGGEVFLDILQREHWRSDQSIGTLLTSIVAVLYDPMLDYPVNGEAADLYKNDIERYEEVAMAWTWEHSTAIVSYSPAKEDKPWLDYCEAVAAMCSADRAEERLRRRRKAEEEEKRLAAAEECKGQIKGRSSGRGPSPERVGFPHKRHQRYGDGQRLRACQLGGKMMGSGPFRARIRRELRKIWVDPPAFCRPGASPVTDLLHWEVVIDGPDGSPYAGGTFPVDIDFIGIYPQTPPKITFKTKVYHPNISADGEMMLDIFHRDNWSPAMTVHKLLLFIVSVLYDPMLDCQPINDEVNEVYESDLELYEQLARAWTFEYSSTPIVSYYLTKEDEERLDYYDAVAAKRSADEAEKRLRRYKAEERRRRRREEEILERRAALSAAQQARRIALIREPWKRAVAFLQGWSVALPFATFRRRFSCTLIPLSNYTGRACS